MPGSLLAQINSHEEKMRGLTDEGLGALTPVFRQRLAAGSSSGPGW